MEPASPLVLGTLSPAGKELARAFYAMLLTTEVPSGTRLEVDESRLIIRHLVSGFVERWNDDVRDLVGTAAQREEWLRIGTKRPREEPGTEDALETKVPRTE